MRVAAYKRLYYTDFPSEDQKVVEQLSYTINNGFDSLFGVVQNNVSIRDNMLASVNDVTVTVDATGKPTSTVTYKISNTNTIDGTEVIKAVSNGNSNIYPTGTPFLSYNQNGAIITLVNVAGLPAGTPFTLRVLTFLT